MRKYSKRIILLIVAIAIIPKMVFAVGGTCDTNKYIITKDATTRTFDLNGGRYVMQFYRTTQNGANVKTYCLDPGRVGLSRTNQYVCERMIDPTGQNAGVGSKEHALDVAITRAYYRIYSENNADTDFNKALGEIVFRWLSFNYNLGVTEVNMSNGTQYVNYFKLEYGGRVKSYWDGLSGENGQIVEKAKEVFYDAVRVGNMVYSGEGLGGSKTYKQLVAEGELPNEEFQYTVTSSVDASMAGRKQYTVQFTAGPAGATVWWNEFQVGIEGGNAKIERVENNGNGTIQIYVNEGYNSGTYKLYVDTTYYLESSAMANLKILKGTNTSATVQRMLVAVDTGNEGAAHEVIKGGQRIPLTSEACTPDKTQVCTYDEDGKPTSCRPAEPGECDDPTPNKDRTCKAENGTYYGIAGNVVTALVFYEECCENPGSGMTEEDKDLYCPCGYPDISFIGNCSEFNTANEITNYVKDVRANADLKTCLFNHASTDAAGNTVRMTDQQTVVNNPYCKVGCIEEYEFTLPSAQYTTSGGYFTLSNSITGKRTCYVNASDDGNFNGIDYKLYKSDLESKRKEVIDAYNEYQKWKAAAAVKATSKGESAPGRSCSAGAVDCTSCSGGDTATNYKKEWSWTSYNYTGQAKSEKDSYNSGGCSTCSCTAGDDPDASGGTYHAGSRDTALATLRTKIKEFNTIVRNYNNCFGQINNSNSEMNSVGWVNNFVFNPSIAFEYDEPYQDMNEFNDKFELVPGTLSNSSDDDYCISVGDTYNCTGSSSVPTQVNAYFTCSETGCSSISITEGAASFITKSRSSSATYQPKNKFSVYTPIGTIKLNEDTGLYTVLCKEENCLPVSLNATTGVFNYQFKFSNIGQYNDSNANGRLMGGANSVFDAVNIDAGYVCQYVNNCPECDYTCVGDKCDIDPDPSCPDCPYVCQNCVFDGSEMTYYYRTVSINNLFPNNRSYGPNWNNSKGTYTKKLVENEGDEAYKEPEYSYTITANQMKNIRKFNDQVGGYLNTQMPNGENALSCFDKSGYQNIYCTSTFLNTSGNTYFTQNVRNDQWTLWQDSGYFTSSTKYSLRDGEGPSWK